MTHPCENPFLFVPISDERRVTDEPELVVSVFRLWMPILTMMLAVGMVTGMLLTVFGILVALVMTAVVTLPVSAVVLLMARVIFPHGVTRKEAARCGLAVGAISATVPAAIVLRLSLDLVTGGQIYVFIAGIVFVAGQVIAGSLGAKSGFDHLMNLVAFGRKDLLGTVIRARPRES